MSETLIKHVETDQLTFLKNVPIFGGLSDDAIRGLLEHSRIARFKDGELIVREGEPASEMYVVLSGGVAVLKRPSAGSMSAADQMLCCLSAGDCFGEMSLIDIQPRSASVRAHTPTELLCLSHDEFARLCATDIETYTLITQNIAREISRRLRQANRVIARLGQMQILEA
ncbi:MAG: Crp/Fnr family transcriptional regulator [Bradymonadia bacterium]